MPDARPIKQNDLLPELTETFEDGNRNPIDLTGATVKFIMTPVGSSTPKINASATIVSPALGQVKYTWTGTDTDTVGRYKAEFEATIGGKKLTAPNDGYLRIHIIDDLA